MLGCVPLVSKLRTKMLRPPSGISFSSHSVGSIKSRKAMGALAKSNANPPSRAQRPPGPRSSPIATLQSMASRIIANIIERGMLHGNAQVPNRDSQTFLERASAAEALFSPDACALLFRLAALPVAARVVLQETLPVSTAQYCAMAIVGWIQNFDITQADKNNLPFNRVLDVEIATTVGPLWSDLQRLTLKGGRITAKFLDTLASGPASQTLKMLDLSSSFVSDAELVPVARFGSTLEHLVLNRCSFISIATVRRIVKWCHQIKILGLNNVDIPLPAILGALMGAAESGGAGTNSLPHLEELHTECDTWGKHIAAMSKFLDTRPNIQNLRVWTFMPNLDFDHTGQEREEFFLKLLTKCPRIERLNMKASALEVLNLAPHLTALQLQASTLSQKDVEFIASHCPDLKSLTLSSTKFSVTPAIELSALKNLKELSLIDTHFGKLESLPPALETLVMSFRGLDSPGCATSIINAICMTKTLTKLHMYTAQAELPAGTAFSAISISTILNSSPGLTDLALDRDLLARNELCWDLTSTVQITHNNLKQLKIISSSNEKKVLPYVQLAPKLVSFESSNHLESISSFDSIRVASQDIRSLRVRLDPSQMHIEQSVSSDSLVDPRNDKAKKRIRTVVALSSKAGPSMPRCDVKGMAVRNMIPTLGSQAEARAKSLPGQLAAEPEQVEDSLEIPDHFGSLSLLTSLAMVGATEQIMAQVVTLKYLHTLKLSSCCASSEILKDITHDLKHLRDVDIERCPRIEQIDCLTGSQIARLRLHSLPSLRGPLKFNGSNLPNLEVLNLSNISLITDLAVTDLPLLRQMTIRSVGEPHSVTIKRTKDLRELVLEGVTASHFVIDAPALIRAFLDCGTGSDRHSADESSSDCDTETGGEVFSNFIQLTAPMLQQLSWQADDVPLRNLIEILAKSPKLKTLEMPTTEMDDFEIHVKSVKAICPKLGTIGCGDGDF